LDEDEKHEYSQLCPVGLCDATIDSIQSTLKREASELSGELVLGFLIEAATDLLDAANSPHGDCIFCMGQMDSTQEVFRLDCYHAFHL
jgi:E3 ubiquitin-protein ligase RNF25